MNKAIGATLTYIGFQALNIALVFSLFAVVLYFVNGKKPYSKYIAAAHRASIATFAMVVLATVALEYALYARDFNVEYVASYSSRALTWFYTFASLWAGQAGSLLFWCLLLNIFMVIVLVQSRKKNAELLPYVMGVMQFTIFFFLYLLVFRSGPFERLPFTPPDGQGLNPLLQNPAMVFHPPSLYTGFVSFTVPFAFAIAALITRKLEDNWVKSVRRWTLFSWLFLTVGNVLGMQWAYVELGWGGYWAWDPVENSALMPWLTGTAFLHSIIVQERKGVLKRWAIALVVLTFALTIFGTFVTRSGLIESVHAFGVSNLGPLFLGFLGVVLAVSFVLLAKRAPLLKGKKDIGSWTSKESGFLLNNLLFLAVTIGVFIGILTPALSELFTGEQVTVGVDWFNRMATPIGIAIFFLIGLAAVLSWGKTSGEKLWHNLLIPLSITAVVLVALVVLGVRGFLPLLSFSVAVFGISTTGQDYIRGVLVHSQRENKNFIAALVSLTLKHKRRYGGYIVHIGVLCLFLGLTGSSAFVKESTATLRKGQAINAGVYNLVFDGMSRQPGKDRMIDTAYFSVNKNGQKICTIGSEKHLFENFQPATEVGIRSTMKEDIYVILADYDLTQQIATVSVLINPLVLWIWIGGLTMVFGTLIAISPDKLGKKSRLKITPETNGALDHELSEPKTEMRELV